MQAVILAAGAGSRLRDVAAVKPLVQIGGRALLLHVLDRLAAAGATAAVVVTGYRAAEVRAALADAPLPVRFANNPDWARAPNGVSLLAAAPLLAERALLTMADHLVEPALYRIVWDSGGRGDPLMLGIDRRLGHPWVDEADVTRVATRGDGILAIGKGLATYDAYDTGVFNIAPAFLAALRRLVQPSLSDGVAALARLGQAAAIDIGARAWLDIDDARMLRWATAIPPN